MSVHLDKKLFLVASLCDAVLNGAPGPSACQLRKPFVCQQQTLAGRCSVGITPKLALRGWWRRYAAILFDLRTFVIEIYQPIWLSSFNLLRIYTFSGGRAPGRPSGLAPHGDSRSEARQYPETINIAVT